MQFQPKGLVAKLPIVLLLMSSLFLVACDDDDDPFIPRDRAAMSWVLSDDCSDGLGLQAALFDTSNNVVFPSRNRVYVAPAGGSIDVTIDCQRGAQICYGAETDPASDLFWGLGIDGDQGCDDCCDLCDDLVVEFVLSCTGPAGSKTATAVRKSKTATQ